MQFYIKWPITHIRCTFNPQYIVYSNTRKTPVSPSPKLLFAPFEFCSSCRRNAFFFLFLSSKKTFWPAATNEFEHVHFAWRAQWFMTLQQHRIAFSLAGAWLFAFLAGSGLSFFVIFFSWLWRRFLHLVGVWGWGHINVLSFPSNDVTLLAFFDLCEQVSDVTQSWTQWLSIEKIAWQG